MTRPNFEARLKEAALNFAANQAMTSATDSRVGFRAGARWAHDEARTVTAEQLDDAAGALWRQVFGHGWEDEPDGVRAYWRRDAAAVLTAAGFTVPEEEQA